MVKEFSSLTLNGHHYKYDELLEFCESQISKKGVPHWESAIYRFILEWLSEEEYVVVHTSGSTGVPKVIYQPKERMINSAKMTAEYFSLNEKINALLCLPVSYIAGKMMVVRAFVTGMNLISVDPSSTPFSQVTENINFAAITPFQLVNSLNQLNENPVDSVIVGGGVIPYDLELECQKLASNIYATYGMTETSSHIAIRAVNRAQKSPFYEVLDGVGISVDERSCLVINAPGLTSDQLITNDVVSIQDPSHFEWIGRIDSVINSGGIKIFPEQVEKKLFPLIAGRFFIAGLPDKLLGEKVALFIEGEPLSQIQLKSLGSAMALQLSKFEHPRKVISVSAFDLSETGKILKKKIAARYIL